MARKLQPKKREVRRNQGNEQEALANSYRKELDSLADILHGRVARPGHPRGPRVVAVVGAGASSAGGLPSSDLLKEAIYEGFRKNPVNADLENLLHMEITASFGSRRTFRDLTLFQFASLVSRSAYGRNVIHKTITDLMKERTHRPLACELLAHLAKHRYIDHVVSVNFDDFIEGAFEDELSTRATVVNSPQTVPLSPEDHRCYVTYPYGILGKGPYCVTTEEVARFGATEVRKFLEDFVCRSRSGLFLILVGYAAAEPGFREFLTQLVDQHPDLQIYAIDPRREPCADLIEAFPKLRGAIHHIGLEADSAFEILLLQLEQRWKKNGWVWVPAARHKIVAQCSWLKAMDDQLRRFELELLLQGIKSRGFVHLEAFSYVRRLKRNGSLRSRRVIDALLTGKILKRDAWFDRPGKEYREFVPNFMIENTQRAADWITEQFCRTNNAFEWRIDARGNFKQDRVRMLDYIRDRTGEIERAPDIEIDDDATPDAAWLLGPEAVGLESLRDLTEQSRRALERLEHSSSAASVRGIWSTGEWLFSEAGWAKGVGKKLLKNKSLRIQVILSAPGGVTGTRSKRREEVLRKLQGYSHVEVKVLPWWELNRVLTLVKRGDDVEAFYMRRRLNRPVVKPYYCSKWPESGGGLRYLEELWERYWERARPLKVRSRTAPTPPKRRRRDRSYPRSPSTSAS